MARRRGRLGDHLAVDAYTGRVCYASQLRKDYWGQYARKPLQRNLQEIASPFNDPAPVEIFTAPDYEDTTGCPGSTAPLYIGAGTTRTSVTGAAAQALNLAPAIPDMQIGCSFLVYPSQTVIKSIQSFEITIATGVTSATQTLTTAVTTDRAILCLNGVRSAETGLLHDEDIPRIELTNSTTVTAYVNTLNSAATRIVAVTVIEFEESAVKLVQHGTVSQAAGDTATTTTLGTSVNPSRAAIIHLGSTVNNAVQNIDRTRARLALAATGASFTTTRASGTGTACVTGYSIIEFQPGITSSIEAASISFNSGTSGTGTLATPVNPTNTILAWGGFTSSGGFQSSMPRAALTAWDTITVTRGASSSNTCVCNVTVIEFSSSLVRAHIGAETTIASGDSVTNVTIEDLDRDNTWLAMAGFSTDTAAANMNTSYPTVTFTSDTNVRVQRVSTGAVTSVAAWSGIEFYG